MYNTREFETIIIQLNFTFNLLYYHGSLKYDFIIQRYHFYYGVSLFDTNRSKITAEISKAPIALVHYHIVKLSATFLRRRTSTSQSYVCVALNARATTLIEGITKLYK